MAIITINTTPVSEFFGRWAEAIGETGLLIIILCLMIYAVCWFTQEFRNDRKRKIERLKNKPKRYYD